MLQRSIFPRTCPNAGVGEFVATDAMTEAHFDKTFDVNVKGTLFTVQKALPLFNDGGSIILTGSISATNDNRAASSVTRRCY